MIYKLINHIRGYYRVFFSSRHPETVLNITMNQNYDVWNIVRKDEKNLSFDIAYKHGEKLFEILNELKKNGTIEYNATLLGGRSFIFRYKRRYGIISGLLISVFLIYLSTLFVWSVKIESDTDFDYELIMSELNKAGLKEGALISSLDFEEIALALSVNNPNISFASVNMKGTKAFVQIHKRTAEVKPVDTKKPYNLVADFDGVVVRCEVTAGMTMVKAGDTVVNGQLLVSGIVDSKSLGFKIVHAAGKIFANTQHNYRVEVAFRQTVKKYTGREETKTSFNMLGAEIDLYFSEDTDFELYDAITVYEDVTLFDVISMPFYLKKNIFLEYTLTEETIDEKRAKDLAYDEYGKLKCLELFDAEIIKEDVKFEILDDKIVLTSVVDCVEDIAKEQRFGVNEKGN